MATRTVRKENILDVFRKLWIPVVLSLAALAFAIIFSGSRQAANAKRENFIPTSAAPVLVPLEFESDETSALGGVVEESEAVSEDYFADAVFCGDSLTDGFQLYGFLRDFTAITKVGVNTYSAQNDAFYELPTGEVVTMVDAITYYHPRKIYLMIGTNGINWETPQWLIENYDTLTDMIRAKNPDAYIILESIPATTRAKSESNSFLALSNILEYNNLIREMCIAKGYYFVDVYSCLCTEDGYLPSSIAAADGTHFATTGYATWYNYLRTHTIKGNSSYAIGPDGRLTISTSSAESPTDAGGETEELPEEEEDD